MGGRRSYSIKDLIKKSPSSIAKRASLTRSFKDNNISGISLGSAKLVPETRDIAKIFIYSQKLLTTIKDKYPPGKLKVFREINQRVRVDWAELKKKHGIESNNIINDAVVDSVSRVLRGKRE